VALACASLLEPCLELSFELTMVRLWRVCVRVIFHPNQGGIFVRVEASRRRMHHDPNFARPLHRDDHPAGRLCGGTHKRTRNCCRRRLVRCGDCGLQYPGAAKKLR
jgi:hypothetical protein